MTDHIDKNTEFFRRETQCTCIFTHGTACPVHVPLKKVEHESFKTLSNIQVSREDLNSSQSLIGLLAHNVNVIENARIEAAIWYGCGIEYWFGDDGKAYARPDYVPMPYAYHHIIDPGSFEGSL